MHVAAVHDTDTLAGGEVSLNHSWLCSSFKGKCALVHTVRESAKGYTYSADHLNLA